MAKNDSSLQNNLNVREPLAIVGMSCRFAPNLNSPQQYWEYINSGNSAVRSIPPGRWSGYDEAGPAVTTALQKATRFGCYMDDIDLFDARFFGVSAREAESLDPQQRIVLELVWEALENAGIQPSSLKGGDTGVFAAANSFDYGHRLFSDIANIEPWALNGGMLFGIANRISYILDLHGPSLVVDTACAGSITALHLGCQSLWDGSTSLAVISAINVMSFPGMQVALDASGATAPDGRCKSFDSEANGYGRGEGGGVVVLKRYSDAVRDNDPVLALIRGSGVFQDGKTAGMMAPNGEAQEQMLRQIYLQAGISPSSVQYIEAHGTGTRLGDKAELTAISRVFGAGRKVGNECLVGSVKPNIGHLEAGAGMAGLIKAVLSINHGQVPRSLYKSLTAEIDWSTAGIKVAGESLPWPETDTPRRAGISCYGVGGTISHAIIESAPTPQERIEASELPNQGMLFPLSGQSTENLIGSAVRLARWLQSNPEVSLADVGHTLGLRRDHLAVRGAVLASTRESLIETLQSAAQENVSEQLLISQGAQEHTKGVVFVFSGHGAQWQNMCQELLLTEPVFAEQVDSLADIFREELGYTAREALEQGDFDSVERTQALTFAVQLGLAALWKSKGVKPEAVIGYSIGEIAASVVAGALEKFSAARFACQRAALYQQLSGLGAMLMVNLPFAKAAERLGGASGAVAAIAASPLSTVLSGDTAAIDRIAEQWASDQIVTRRVATDVAFHSPHIDRVINDIRIAASDLVFGTPDLVMYNTVLQDARSSVLRDDAFWTANSRNPVLFDQAVSAALDDGFSLFLEVSSKPIVSHSIRETADLKACDEVVVCATLKPGKPQRQEMLNSLARLYCEGANLDWGKMFSQGALVDIPTMTWNHQRYWTHALPARAGAGKGHDASLHSLLGARRVIRTAPPCDVWQTRLDFASRPYPEQHPICGVEIMPAAVLLNSFLQTQASSGASMQLKDVALLTPIAVEGTRDLQIVRQGKEIRLSSRLVDESLINEQEAELAWLTHTTAALEWGVVPLEQSTSLNDWVAGCTESLEWASVEPLYRRRGIADYGFRWKINELHRGEGRLVVRGQSEVNERQINSWAVVLDAVLTMMPLLLADDDVLRMPAAVDELSVTTSAPATYTVLASLAAKVDDESPSMDVLILDENDQVVGKIKGLLFATVDRKDDLELHSGRTLFVETWAPWTATVGKTAKVPHIILLGGEDGYAQQMAVGLRSAGISSRVESDLDQLDLTSHESVLLVLGSPPLADEALEQNVERNAWKLLSAAQRTIKLAQQFPSLRLGCVTFGVRQLQDQGSLGQATLWGMSRIIAGEHPGVWAGLVDIEPKALSDQSTYISVVNAIGNGLEDVISISSQGIDVLRLSDLPSATHTSVGQPLCNADATYVITGGFGELGLHAAQHLVNQGARRLLLAGRNGLPPRSQWAKEVDPRMRAVIEGILSIERQGVTVVPLVLDVADSLSVREAFTKASLEMPAIRGIVHAAGTFAGGMVETVERSDLHTVLRAKVNGTLALANAFADKELDFFVLFSSSGQLARLSGQVGYAAANSFMDAYARYLTSTGRKALSIGWMAWDSLGMSRNIEATMTEARANGLDSISVPIALAAWHAAHEAGLNYAAVFRPVRLEEVGIPLPVLSGVLKPFKAQTGEPSSGSPWALVAQEELKQWFVNDVQALVAAELRCAPSDINPKRSLVDKGLDSLITVALRIRLKKRYRIDIPSTLIWNHPTAEAIASFIESHLVTSAT